MPYWRLFYHIVWSTKYLLPLIEPAWEADLHGYMWGKATALECIPHAINGMPDHIHVVISIPPKLSIAKLIGQLKGASSHRVNEIFVSNLANAYAASGRKEEAIKIVNGLEDRPSQSSSTGSNIALIYVGLGDKDQAMVWLNKAYQARFNPSILLRPAFDPLRSDARFQDLLRHIGLPQAARDILH